MHAIPNPPKSQNQNTSRPEPETANERARREAFFTTRGPTQPPGGKAGAWARRMAGKALR